MTLGLALASGAVVTGGAWRAPQPPSAPNSIAFSARRSAVVATPRNSSANAESLRPEGFGVNRYEAGPDSPQGGASVQGVDVDGAVWEQGVLSVSVEVAPGGSARVGYVHATGPTGDEATALFDELRDRVVSSIEAATAMWNRELAAMFTPGQCQLRRMPTGTGDVVGRAAADLLVGRPGRAVVPPRQSAQRARALLRHADAALLADLHVHVGLQHELVASMPCWIPTTMRRHLEHWVSTDIHTHFGTEWQTGGRGRQLVLGQRLSR